MSIALSQALSLTRGMTISVVGAGGKTTLIFALATELAALGHSVLVTTTTAIFHPDHGNQPYDKIVIGDIKKVCQYIPKAGQIMVAGQSHDLKTKKLKGYSPDKIARLQEGHSFDYILIEADGAKMLPVKAPADHEPVIPAWTDMVIGCIGLDCLGKPMDGQTVHRPKIFSAITKIGPGDTIQADHLVYLVAASQGLFKNTKKNMQKIVFLNKADTRELGKKGRTLADKILKKCPQVDNCLVACLLDTKKRETNK